MSAVLTISGDHTARRNATFSLAVTLGALLLAACGSSAPPPSAAAPATSAPAATPSDRPPGYLLLAGCNAISVAGGHEGHVTSASSVLTTSSAVNALGLLDHAGYGDPRGTPRLTLPSTPPQVVVTQVEGKFRGGLHGLTGGASSWPPESFTTQLMFSTPAGDTIERPPSGSAPPGLSYDQLAESIPDLASLGTVHRTTPARCDRELGLVSTGSSTIAPPT